MGVGTILSHGLSSYFGTKNAMDEQEYRRQMQERETQRAQREGQRHQAWLAELERGNKDRAESDQFYADMANNGIEPAPQAQNVSLDQGNGVTTVPYGMAKPEALTVETMPESPVPPKSAPGAGAAVGAQTPGTGASVEPITPAAVASRGVQPGPAKLDMPSLMDAKSKLDSLRLRAMKIKDPNAMAYLNEQGRSILGQWASAFDGDPTANPIGYAKHLAQAKAVFGEPLTMDEASRIYAAQKAYEAEGVTEALKALHSGNRATALKAYEKGKHRVADVQLTPAKSSAGLPSYNVTIKNADGTTETFNAFDAMMSMAGAEAQLKAFIDQQKLNNDTRKTDADAAESGAKARYYDAYAGYRTARANASEEDGGELTIPQQRKNEEIKAARKQLTGLSKAELLRRTQSFTNTNRANPDYDPQLAAMARLANSRMYGDDPEFDRFTAQAQPATTPSAMQPGKPAGDSPRARFDVDPDMRGLKLGKPTGQGWEVLDPSGRVIGHWK